MFLSLFYKVGREGIPPNSFYRASAIPTPNPKKVKTKEVIDQFCNEYRQKGKHTQHTYTHTPKISINQIQEYDKKVHHGQANFILGIHA